MNDLCSGYYYNTDNLAYSLLEAYMCAVIDLLFLVCIRDGELTTKHSPLITSLFSCPPHSSCDSSPFLVCAEDSVTTGPLPLPYLLPGILLLFSPWCSPSLMSHTSWSPFCLIWPHYIGHPLPFIPLGFLPQNFPQHDSMLSFHRLFAFSE